jgi:beta-glucosidase
MIRMEPNIEPQPRSIMKCKEHLDLAEESARKGMVLLKNSGNLLPLSVDEPLAVVGPFADTVNVGDNGSSSVLAKDGFTAFAGLQKKFRHVNLFNGLDPQKALAAAQDAEVVIACVGCDSSDEGEFLINVGEDMDEKPKHAPGGDRDYLHLHPEHLDLLKGLKSAGKKVIAVLFTGSVVLTEELEPYCDAIIMGYYGGYRFGKALATLLCGEENFSGKLPVSIAKAEQDYPSFLDIGQKPYEIEFDYYNGYYRFEKEGIQPAYPFGFGLSYTEFTISNVSIKQNAGEKVTVSAAVKNVGSRAGAEVVQVYVGSAGGKEHRPLKMLRGFTRVELEPDESKEVHTQVDVADLKFYDAVQKTWVLDPEYRIYVGNSSDRADLVGSVRFSE